MNTRERVMRDVFDLFISKGDINLSVNDILKELKMTKGGFYYYFKSKDELMEEIINRYMLGTLRTELDSLYCADMENMPLKGRLRLFYCLLPRPKIRDDDEKVIKEYDVKQYFILFYGLLDKYPELGKGYKMFYKENMQYIKRLLSEGIVNGMIKDCIDPEKYAQTMLTIREGIAAFNMIDDNIDIDNRLNESFETVWNEINNEVA